MELILKHLGAVTLSTKGLIILEEEKDDFTVIASIARILHSLAIGPFSIN